MSEEATAQVDDEQSSTEVAADGAALSSDSKSDIQGAADTIEESAAPAQSSVAPGDGQNAATDVRKSTDPIDIDAELSAKERLADDLNDGRIDIADYNKAVAKHDRNITTAQRKMLEPAQAIAQADDVRKQNQQFFQNWGKGAGVAQIKYGKSVTGTAAQKAFNEAEAEVLADPTYANRPEFDMATVIRMKWMEKLDQASKAKPAPATQTRSAAQQPAATRYTGNSAASVSSGGESHKTAKQKLEDGDYGDLAGEQKGLL